MSFGDYYDPSDKAVVDGDTILAADLNAINLATDAGFDQVASDMDTLNGPGVAPLQNLTPAANRFPYYTSGSAAALATITTQGRALIDDATAADQRTTLGLGNVANVDTTNASNITSGTLADGLIPSTITRDSEVNTATQAALDLKSTIASPTFTGTPAAPTAAVGTSTTQLATTAFAVTEITRKSTSTLLDYGGSGNGSDDNLAAINLAIAALNAGTITSLYIPPGTYNLSGVPNAITADRVSIFGIGAASKLVMASGISGTFFTLGTDSNPATGVSIFNLLFNCTNTATLTASPVFKLVRTVDTLITNIYAGISGYGVASFIQLGDSGTNSLASRTRMGNLNIQLYGPAEGTCFDLQWANGTKVVNCTINCGDASITGAVKGIHIHPVGTDSGGVALRTCDSGIWYGVEFNFPSDNIDECLVIDSSQGIVINQWFTDCIFDQVEDQSIKLLVSAGAHASARMNNLYFTNCRAYVTEGGAFVIDNTGDREIANVNVFGGVLTSYGQAAVRLSGTSAKIDISFDNVNFNDLDDTTTKAVIDVAGTLTLKVNSCKAQHQNPTSGNTAFAYFLNPTANISNWIITNNDCLAIDNNLINFTNITDRNTTSKVVKNNLTSFGEHQMKIATVDATTTTILEIDLKDFYTYTLRAQVIGRQNTNVNRASYELIGTFYRDGATVTQQGSTTSLHAVESNAAWNCEFVISSTKVLLQVTGAAATNVAWVANLSFTSDRII